ncbi:MAG: helix-turn-helix domain-containing protein, partial [Lachnospiraceae bacterium]|nr:helix-turn-helix domain-containing protein [Lachnospiraceae bacterium]
MELGERIKEIRKKRGLSVEEVAEKLDVSISTLYRYENSSISKIPVSVMDKLCTILATTPSELMGNEVSPDADELPQSFANAEQAMAFMLKMPI